MAVAIPGSIRIVEVGWSLKLKTKISRNYIKSIVSKIELEKLQICFEAV